MMTVVYSFKSVCYQTTEYKERTIDAAEGLTYGKAVELLNKEGVKPDHVQQLRYRYAKSEDWRLLGREPVRCPGEKGKIFLRVLLKPCVEMVEADIRQEMASLKDEVRKLRKSISQLKEEREELQEVITNCLVVRELPRDLPRDLPSFHKLSSGSSTFAPLMSRLSIIQPERPVSQRTSDIIYLYSAPLLSEEWNVILSKFEPVALMDPLDTSTEMEELQKKFMQSKKELVFTINTGSMASLREALEMRPKILHISCHGGLDKVSWKPYLQLEGEKRPGLVEKLFEEDALKLFKLLKTSDQTFLPRLVFISACHSQAFGQAIQSAGVPYVVAVNGYTQVADEAATSFASAFYRRLLEGESVKSAFANTKEYVGMNDRDLRLCCCTHTHTEDCSWVKDAVEGSQELAHQRHVPDCGCPHKGNLHKCSCQWASYIESTELFCVDEVKVDGQKYKRVCCCRPDLPHNEEEKFMLFTNGEEAESDSIFASVPKGELIVDKHFNEDLVPKLDDVLIGRNVELQQLVELLLTKSAKIISVVGPPGSGKTLLIRTAAKYVMERGSATRRNKENFSDGFVSINLLNTTELLSKLNSALLPRVEIDASCPEELSRKIKQYKKLVLIECENVMETNSAELIKILNKILAEGASLKFILTARKKVYGLQVDDEVILKENLIPLDAYNIIKANNPKWQHVYAKFVKRPFAKKLTSPWLIRKVAMLLKHSDLDEVEEQLINEQIITKDESGQNEGEGYNKLIENTLAEIKSKCGYLTPIQMLAQLSSGAFESDFIELTGSADPEYKNKLDEYIRTSGSEAMIIKTKVEGVDEPRYRVSQAIIYSINSQLKDYEIVQHQRKCIEQFAKVARRLVQSYNHFIHNGPQYDEFSAILNEGIWESNNKECETSELTNPTQRFQCEKENIMSLLMPGLLLEIMKESKGHELEKFLNNVKELAICTISLLLHLKTPNEAMHVIDEIQGFVNEREKMRAACDNQSIVTKYKELNGTMKLIKASTAVSSILESKRAEAINYASEAENYFTEAKSNAGIAEAVYLRALLMSEIKHRTKDTEEACKLAKHFFEDAECKLGMARVSIVEALLLIRKSKMDDVLSLFDAALKTIEQYDCMDKMVAICYSHRAEYWIHMKNYEFAQQDLNKAFEKYSSLGDVRNENQCNSKMQEVMDIMQEGCPLFAFLQASPLVMLPQGTKIEFTPLKPNVRRVSTFSEEVTAKLESLNKSVKVYFDTLTYESLKKVLARGCGALYIASDYYAPGTLGMEGELGNLNEMQLDKLQQELSQIEKIELCKVVVIAVPQAEDIAQMFVNLGVEHVVVFRFFDATPNPYEERFDVQRIEKELMQEFCMKLYESLLEGKNMNVSWKQAIVAMETYAESKGKQMEIPNLYNLLEPQPELLPSEDVAMLKDTKSKHDIAIFEELEAGKCINMSPKRAECSVEKDPSPFVGRQALLYRIARKLRDNVCVNLYGQYGTGKTRLAKEVGYFLYTRQALCSNIIYLEVGKRVHSFQESLSQKFQSSRGAESSLILVILDGIDRVIWQKERHYYKSLHNDRGCVFLFASRDPLDGFVGSRRIEKAQEFPMARYELKQFGIMEDAEIELSLDYIFALMEHMDTPIPKSVGVPRKDLRDQVLRSPGFLQANGYPALLTNFCELLSEKDSLDLVNLLDKDAVDDKYVNLVSRMSEQQLLEERKGAGNVGQSMQQLAITI